MTGTPRKPLPHLVAIALFGAAHAQTPAAGEVPTLAELADRVERAHRPDEQAATPTQFACNLELHLIDKTAEQGGQVDMNVKFMLWKQPGKDKVRKLIRYEVRDAEQPIMRGRDENGPWQLHRGEARDLYGADFTDQDRKTFAQHTNLARQLLRFLSPADVIRSLRNAGLVQQEELPIKRVPTACYTIEGRLDSFPLMQQGGEDASVQLKIWVRADDGHLACVEATPLVDGAPATTRGERIVLADLRERDGRLVPCEITHLFRDRKGALRPVTRVKLTTVELAPGLQAADFARKQ